MPSGGSRKGAGRPKGARGKATIERAIQVYEQVKRSVNKQTGEIELGRSVIERQMKLAESMCARYQVVTEEQAKALRDAGNAKAKEQPGDAKLYGDWFDRWAKRADELTKYQSPPIRGVDAPAPAPDPQDLERQNTRRFGLRVFEGGKPLIGQPANDAA